MYKQVFTVIAFLREVTWAQGGFTDCCCPLLLCRSQ